MNAQQRIAAQPTTETDAIDAQADHGRGGLRPGQILQMYYDHAARLEQQRNYLMEVLEDVEKHFKSMPRSLGYEYDIVPKVRAALTAIREQKP